jgi:hypothetical protein
MLSTLAEMRGAACRAADKRAAVSDLTSVHVTLISVTFAT